MVKTVDTYIYCYYLAKALISLHPSTQNVSDQNVEMRVSIQTDNIIAVSLMTFTTRETMTQIKIAFSKICHLILRFTISATDNYCTQ